MKFRPKKSMGVLFVLLLVLLVGASVAYAGPEKPQEKPNKGLRTYQITITNSSGVLLTTGNSATLHVLVYEDSSKSVTGRQGVVLTADGPLESRRRVGGPAQPVVRHRQPEPGVDIVGLQGDGPFI